MGSQGQQQWKAGHTGCSHLPDMQALQVPLQALATASEVWLCPSSHRPCYQLATIPASHAQWISAGHLLPIHSCITWDEPQAQHLQLVRHREV